MRAPKPPARATRSRGKELQRGPMMAVRTYRNGGLLIRFRSEHVVTLIASLCRGGRSAGHHSCAFLFDGYNSRVEPCVVGSRLSPLRFSQEISLRTRVGSLIRRQVMHESLKVNQVIRNGKRRPKLFVLLKKKQKKSRSLSVPRRHPNDFQEFVHHLAPIPRSPRLHLPPSPLRVCLSTPPPLLRRKGPRTSPTIPPPRATCLLICPITASPKRGNSHLPRRLRLRRPPPAPDDYFSAATPVAGGAGSGGEVAQRC